MLRFDWDERKNKNKRIKHGTWFEEAQSFFSDPHGCLFYDPEHEFSGKNAYRSSLLQGKQFRGRDYFCP
jgi:uncharacterized DUF497 family protein